MAKEFEEVYMLEVLEVHLSGGSRGDFAGGVVASVAAFELLIEEF